MFHDFRVENCRWLESFFRGRNGPNMNVGMRSAANTTDFRVTKDAPLLLSWNSARFLALIFNALTGLLRFYEREADILKADSIFALRVAQGHLEEIHEAFDHRGFHPEILSTVANLSATARIIAAKSSVHFDDIALDERAKRLFGEGHRLGVARHRRVNENLRWPLKDLLPRDSRHYSSAWFDPIGDRGYFDCLLELFDNNGHASDDSLKSCVKRILTREGRIGFQITRQVFFLTIANMTRGTARVGAILREISPPNSTIRSLEDNIAVANYYVERLCANVRDELAHYRRDKKKLARLQSSDSVDLLMEQMFVCLQFGYVDFAEPHVLVTVLSWQHPALGCYTVNKPESMPQFGISDDAMAINPGRNSGTGRLQSKSEEACRQHTSSSALMVMIVFLRYILDPGPWPEFQFADQLVQIDQIIAEDRFSSFKYVKWVRDTSIHAVPLSQPLLLGRDSRNRPPAFNHEHKVVPKPPPIAWSPDLIAFVVLLLIFVGVSVVTHHFLGVSKNKDGPRIAGKRVYPYASKKL